MGTDFDTLPPAVSGETYPDRATTLKAIQRNATAATKHLVPSKDEADWMSNLRIRLTWEEASEEGCSRAFCSQRNQDSTFEGDCSCAVCIQRNQNLIPEEVCPGDFSSQSDSEWETASDASIDDSFASEGDDDDYDDHSNDDLEQCFEQYSPVDQNFDPMVMLCQLVISYAPQPLVFPVLMVITYLLLMLYVAILLATAFFVFAFVWVMAENDMKLDWPATIRLWILLLKGQAPYTHHLHLQDFGRVEEPY